MATSSHDVHHHDDGAGHGTVGSYIIGFVLAVVLTIASFAVVIHGGFSATGALIALAVLAAVQMVVHLVFFLHLNSSSAQRWNVSAFIFTVITAAIIIGGSLWIMHNVTVNMMSR